MRMVVAEIVLLQKLQIHRYNLDTFLYTVLMFFCHTVAHLLMPKRSENVGKRMEQQPYNIHLSRNADVIQIEFPGINTNLGTDCLLQLLLATTL